ncbi:hypothetical protein EON65_29950 [archaeon]|nr:MAG: hypothetical protein EON65_29950 [archaeon]
MSLFYVEIEKRKAEDSITTAVSTTTKPPKPTPSVSILSKKYATESATSSQTMAVSRDNLACAYQEPDFDNLVNTYLEADDPDAGIEEEYHPKHNQCVMLL